MRKSPSQQQTKKRSLVFAFALGMMFFFNNCTLAPHFDTVPSAKEKYKHRLPTSTGGQTLSFDCSKPAGNQLELSTTFETIRIEAVNCHTKLIFKDESHSQPLFVFARGPQQFSTELAYLSKGRNSFSITVAEKVYQLGVERF